jgi:hypothetical protein
VSGRECRPGVIFLVLADGVRTPVVHADRGADEIGREQGVSQTGGKGSVSARWPGCLLECGCRPKAGPSGIVTRRAETRQRLGEREPSRARRREAADGKKLEGKRGRWLLRGYQFFGEHWSQTILGDEREGTSTIGIAWELYITKGKSRVLLRWVSRLEIFDFGCLGQNETTRGCP